jgi:type IV pilus assembly protein PilV
MNMTNPKTDKQARTRASQQGFSMLEILVTLAVTAIALLGTAALQLNALRMGQGSQFRNQAVFLAGDIAERMEANKLAAVAGSYALALTAAPPAANDTCSIGACTSAQLAAYDLALWQNTIAAVLPTSSWSVTQTTAGNPSTYTITVNWTDRRGNTTYANVGSGEVFSYTATRTIFN